MRTTGKNRTQQKGENRAYIRPDLSDGSWIDTTSWDQIIRWDNDFNMITIS